MLRRKWKLWLFFTTQCTVSTGEKFWTHKGALRWAQKNVSPYYQDEHGRVYAVEARKKGKDHVLVYRQFLLSQGDLFRGPVKY